MVVEYRGLRPHYLGMGEIATARLLIDGDIEVTMHIATTGVTRLPGSSGLRWRLRSRARSRKI